MSCSEDGNSPDETDESGVTSDLSDLSELSVGEAEFAASGYSNFNFEDVSARWSEPGSISYGDINYSTTTIVLQDAKDSLRLNIILYVDDPEEEGKLPTEGDYPVGVESTPEQYSSVSISPLASFDSWNSYNNSTGKVEITQIQDSVFSGILNINKLDTAEFGSNETQSVNINLGAKFKAEFQ